MAEPDQIASVTRRTPERRLSDRIGERVLQELLTELADAIERAAQAGGDEVVVDLSIDAAGNVRKGHVSRSMLLRRA